MPQCHSCGTELVAETQFGRQDNCFKCGSSTRVCLNCANYDHSKYNECTEPVAERIVDKEKANFCDYFKPASKNDRSGMSAREQALKAAEALFKKGN